LCADKTACDEKYGRQFYASLGFDSIKIAHCKTCVRNFEEKRLKKH